MFSRNYIFTAAAMTIVAMANPTLAAPATDGTEQVRAKVVKRGGQTLYCMTELATGTRVSREVCLTEQELAQTGSRIERVKDKSGAMPIQTARAH